MRYWILQANPNRYDLRRALQELTEIHWRVPQHTAEIRPGDVALLWEAGGDAGIVGLGRIAGHPAELGIPANEDRFTTDRDSDPTTATRARVLVRPSEFLAKADVAAVGLMASHPIITGPMGTVFALDDDEWDALTAAFPGLQSIPPLEVSPAAVDWPVEFAWQDRRKSVYPLPGGYDSYAETLRRILTYVRDAQPERSDLEAWMQDTFGVSPHHARYTLDFVQRVGLLTGGTARISPSPEALAWLESKDDAYLIALMHTRVRFVGEFLAQLDQARSTTALLGAANDSYGMGWGTRAQVDRRRHWLQGFGMVGANDDGLLVRTEKGTTLLQRLRVEPLVEGTGSVPQSVKAPREPPSAESTEPATVALPDVSDLAAELVAAGSDTSDPSRFERVAADAFAFLGFDSTWLGGAGKTDVLLVAPLGPDEGYRVIVDCKTTSHEGVQDHQIDWVTLADHRAQHEADFVVVLAPALKGSRIRERAEKQQVTLLDAETFAGLLDQHVATPLGLDDYRQLFVSADDGDGVGTVGEHSEDAARWQRLVGRICRVLLELEVDEGWLAARDLYWNFKVAGDEEESFTEKEIQAALGALASPAIGAIRTDGSGFKSLGARATTVARLQRLADEIEKASK